MEQNAWKVKIVVVHIGTVEISEDVVNGARNRRGEVYLSLRPSTIVDAVLPYVKMVDDIQIMTG